MSFLVHACDISNPTMIFEDFREWGIRITQEFQDLFNAENDLVELKGDENSGPYGVTRPLPFLEYKNWKGYCMGQVGFTKTFVVPLWELLAKIDHKL